MGNDGGHVDPGFSGLHGHGSNIRTAHLRVSETETLSSLGALADALSAKADDALRWYEQSQRNKKRWAIRLRLMAIVLGVLAALVPAVLPVLSPLVRGSGDQWSVTDLVPLATVFGILAGALILLDKFFGFSSGWMRYAMAYQEIQARQERFRIEWARGLRRAGSAALSPDQVAAAFALLLDYCSALNGALISETQAWVIEFRGSLGETERFIEAQRQSVAAVAAASRATGGLRVRVDGLDRLDDRRWSLLVGTGATAVDYDGQDQAAMLLEPGLVKVRFEACKGGTPIIVEDLANVESNQTSVVVFQVP